MGITFTKNAVLCCALLCTQLAAASDEPLQPLPDLRTLKLDARKIQLGRALFHDVRLSKNDIISCASCHILDAGGVDNKRYSMGASGTLGKVNTPTVLNAGNNFHQFWDGRADSLEEQVADSINSPTELASNWPAVLAKLNHDAGLVQQFKTIYTDGVQAKNIQDAIAVFERSLLTPSRFDRYLSGDVKAISAEELEGYKKFKDYGCVGCHQGVNVGGNMFQTFGVMHNYFKVRGNQNEADLGRFNVTKLESDKHVFKVPSLRNVALTAPYFHDGSATTLSDAVNVMFKYQLGRRGSEADKALIIKFLHTLTGETLSPK